MFFCAQHSFFFRDEGDRAWVATAAPRAIARFRADVLRAGDGMMLTCWWEKIMAEKISAPVNPWAKPPPTALRRWRWAIISGGILLFLLLLALLAPSIASMGWARSIVLGRINDNLNGRVTIDDWSLGWTTGTDITGLKVFDDQNREVLACGHLQTELTVMQLLKGDYYTLGKTTLQGLSFTMERGEDGIINLQRLSKGPSSGKPFEMPKIHGTFDVDFHGTITDKFGGANRTIIVDRSSISVSIPDINGQIEHDVELSIRTGDGPTGQISAKGTVKAFEDGQFDLAKFGAVEDVTLNSVALDDFTPFLDPASPITMLKGLTNGHLKVSFTGQDEMQIEGDATSTEFKAGGPALFGDTYASGEVSLKIPPTIFNRSTGRIRVGAEGKGESIALKFAQGTIYLSMDATQEALMKVAQNQAPGGEGSVTLVTDVDIQAMAKQLPKLMQLAQGVRVDSGKFHEQTSVKFAADKAIFKQQIDIRELSGVDVPHNRKLSAEPLSLTFDFTSVGGGGVVPNLRDFAVAIKSGFGTINGSGESIAKLNVKGTLDLAKGQREAAQFFNFGKLTLDGVANFAISTAGDLTKEESAATIDVMLESTQLKIGGLTAQSLDEPWMKLAVKGKLVRGKDQFVKSLTDAVVTLQTGDPAKPTVDVKALGDIILAAKSVSMPRIEIERLNIDLPAAQAELSPVLGLLAEQGISFPSGAISLSASGSFDAAGVKLKSLKVAANGVTYQRQKLPILSNYTATVDLAGAMGRDEKGMEIRLSSFAYADSAGLLKLDKLGDQDLVVTLLKEGLSANGKLKLDANLKELSDLAQRVSGKPIELTLVDGRKKPGQLLSGRLAGTLEFARGGGQSSLVGDLALSNLGVTTFQKDIENERVTLILRASAKDDFSAFTIGQADLRSAFMNVILSDAKIQLSNEGKPVPSLEMVQQARLFLDIPDVPRAKALMDAILPEQSPSAATAHPIEVVHGSAKGTLTIARAEKGIAIGVEDFKAGQFLIQRGAGHWGPKEISLRLAATLVANPELAAKPPLEQLQEIQVTALSGDLGVANVQLQEPIIIKDPLGQAMSAAGAVKIDGRLADIGQLVAALDGQEKPGPEWDYSGDYSLNQKISTQGKVVTAAGTVEVRQFVYGKVFSEGLLTLSNEITLDQAAKVLDVKGFSVQMEQSKALSVSISSGKIEHYDTRPAVNLVGKLGYDAQAVMKIVWPQLPKDLQQQLAGLKLSGVAADREFAIKGQLPPPNAKGADLLANVTAQLSLFFDKIEYQGMTGEHLELPIHIANGKISTIYADKQGGERFASAASLNGGSLDLSGFELSLNSQPIRISALRNEIKVLDNVNITPEFTEKYLASASPFFAGSEQSRGNITLTIDMLKQLRLDPLIMHPPAEDPGMVKISFEVRELALKNKATKQLDFFLNLQKNPDGSIPTAVHDAHAELGNGKLTTRMDIETAGNTIQCRDGVATLADQKIKSMNLIIPEGMVKKELVSASPLKPPLIVPVTGTLEDPRIDGKKAVADNIAKNLIPGQNGKPQLPNLDKPSLDKPSIPSKPDVPGKPSFPRPF
jgi:hypothetical protein